MTKRLDSEKKTMKKNMRKRTILIVAALALTAALHAQSRKVIADAKGRIGYADVNGNKVIDCKYDSGTAFENGTAIVMKSDKYGVIDEQGKELIKLDYTQIVRWNDAMFLLRDGKKYGMADIDGNVVLPAKYSFISNVNVYGRALIASGGSERVDNGKTYLANAKYGVINNRGEMLVNPEHKGLYEFAEDCSGSYPMYMGKRLRYTRHYLADTLVTDCSFLGVSSKATSEKDAALIDGSGNVLIKENTYGYIMQPQNDMVRYYITKSDETLCGYYNLNMRKGFQVASFNTAIRDMKIFSHGDFIGDMAPVNGDKWSFVDKQGNVLRSGYERIKYSKTMGLWAAQKTALPYEVFDINNTVIEELSKYDDLNFPLKEGDKDVIAVKKHAKYGAVTRSGAVVVPFEYNFIGSLYNNTFFAKKNDKAGMISVDNKIVVPLEFADVIIPIEKGAQHYWVKCDDGLMYHYDVNKKTLAKQGFRQVEAFKNGMAFVIPTTITVEDTPVNRAQMLEPNAKNEDVANAKVAESDGKFGYIVNTDNVLVIDRPVSVLYKDEVLDVINKLGKKTLSDSEKKDILLYVTRTNRFYDLSTVIDEEEWNF